MDDHDPVDLDTFRDRLEASHGHRLAQLTFAGNRDTSEVMRYRIEARVFEHLLYAIDRAQERGYAEPMDYDHADVYRDLSEARMRIHELERGGSQEPDHVGNGVH